MGNAESHFAYCEALVREGDPDRYWASLFAPLDKRPHLYALYAFNFEIARVREAVREADPDRYWASLFAPADKRPHLYALHAFNFEIARVRESVREAMVGEIRLQWWRDALQGEARGDVRANPVAAALDDTIVKFRLPRQALVNLIDARIFDLYEDPMPSLNDLEG